ncbi:EAL domain-containing protein (plasmid) [Tistrella bauzanensis]|uniref:putative bifunctional diguanylate cyclase/phosphodiesterase n=1 Tax=Tistrella TaxID=171436 RepID=UPI0031F70BFE
MAADFPVPEDETDRLESLASYHLVDTAPEADFDRLVSLASRLFDAPIVLVSLLAADRQVFKARIGLDVCETSRAVSFCAHAIMRDEIMVVLDAIKDSRFSRNPLVLGPPFIRFYAGKPIAAPDGRRIGTLCVIDTAPRGAFSAADHANLEDMATLVMDRMEMRRLDHIQSNNQMRFKNIAATSPDAIICADADGRIGFWNAAAERLFGYTADDIENRTADVIIPDRWRPAYHTVLRRLRTGRRLAFADRTLELSGMRKDGSVFPVEFSFSTWSEGSVARIGVILRDVTERHRSEERLYRLASFDALTDLANRGAWTARLTDIIDAGSPATVLLIDLDGFKEVNDSFGHAVGDLVLKGVADRLKASCCDAIMVGRLGGDEFVVLLPGSDPRRANLIAADLVTTIAQPYLAGTERVALGASIGVALSPQHATRPEDLLKAADLALYRAKASGRCRYEMFTPWMREVAVQRRAFEQELRRAFEREEFALFYQPLISTADRRVTGCEALIRWNHPERGLLSPASFIDVLSQKPSAADIGNWVIRSACRQLAEWRKIQPDLRVSVNLFEAQLRSARFLTVVRDILESFGLPPEALELEIVETIILRDDRATMKLLQDLREMGVGLAFDDYGTGFASLSLLKTYPVTRLKIDKSFVRNVTSDVENAALVRAVLSLGRSFGMDVIAEGVETQEQYDFLVQYDCAEVQGYLFGRPVPADEFHRDVLLPAIENAGPP